MKRYVLYILFFFVLSLFFAEDARGVEGIEELPSAFHDIGLGMSIEDVKETLKKDESFAYRGEKDVSLLGNKNRSLIESEGSYFVRRGLFQFYNEKLYTIIVQMNPENIDYYSIYSSLVEKYGEPGLVDQKKALWENDRVRLVLERPLTIKYIDTATFNEILAARSKKRAVSDEVRERFVNAF